MPRHVKCPCSIHNVAVSCLFFFPSHTSYKRHSEFCLSWEGVAWLQVLHTHHAIMERQTWQGPMPGKSAWDTVARPNPNPTTAGKLGVMVSELLSLPCEGMYARRKCCTKRRVRNARAVATLKGEPGRSFFFFFFFFTVLPSFRPAYAYNVPAISAVAEYAT